MASPVTVSPPLSPAVEGKAARRGSATASTTSSTSGTLAFHENHDNNREEPAASTAGAPTKGKAHRRVSFTTETPMEHEEEPPPPFMVVTNSKIEWTNASTDTLPSDNSSTNASASTNATATATANNMTSPQRKYVRGSSLEATPHHSNNSNSNGLAVPADTSLNSQSNHNNNTASSSNGAVNQHQYLQFSQSFPAARPMSPPYTFRSNNAPSSTTRRTNVTQSRRTSLDSCSTYSSHNSASVYSTGGSLASLLNSKDENFQRTKLLECVEWLSRHLSRRVVWQLMREVQQQHHQQSIPQGHPREVAPTTTTTATTSTSTTTLYHQHSVMYSRGRRASTGMGSRLPTPTTSTKGILFKAQPRRFSLPNHLSSSGSAASFAKRRSCSFVRCKKTVDATAETETDSDVHMDESNRRRQQRVLRTQQSLDSMSRSAYDGCTTDDDDDASFSDDDDDDDDQGSINLAFDEEHDELEESVENHNIHHNSSKNYWENNHDVPVGLCIPPESHRSALLLVDISGFTKLSTTLSLQALSETINAYFQRIIACIQDYGGDVVKFAGDAVMAEWRQSNDNSNNVMADNSNRLARDLFGQMNDASSNNHNNDDNLQNQQQHVVQLATACACQIVQTCSDYNVYEDKAETNLLATLNVHCGLGFGTVVGFHAGDDSRREYLLLGDPISQAGDAIALGRGGEVVASPEAFAQLLTNGVDKNGEEEEETTKENKITNPQVIFSSRKDRDETTADLLEGDKLLLAPTETMSSKLKAKAWKSLLKDWDVGALFKLQELMALYVHPVVVEGELFTSVFHNRGALTSTSFDSDSETSQQNYQQQGLQLDQRMYQSEAEIRQVFTVFVQPKVSVNVTGDPAKDEAMMTTLNQILVVANRELARFKGLLRQFVVDDKGLVLIANFGLRGSVCPRMIEEHAMPFSASLRSALRAELGVDTVMGATYDSAYCGVVGGHERHEYSVLGPAVNLAARLMGSEENHGFLVASGVHDEACGWTFRALEPVKAKGYENPVPIFAPLMHRRSPWQRSTDCFVGRQEEIDSIVEFSEGILATGCDTAKLVLISASSGIGKSTLMTEAVNHIEKHCENRKRSHLILGQVCCEEDLFQPLSVLGPVLLDILVKAGTQKAEAAPDGDEVEMIEGPTGTALCNGEEAIAVDQFNAACQNAGIADETVEIMHSLVFHHVWPDSASNHKTNDDLGASQHWSTPEKNEMAQLIVSILLQATVDLDVVLLGVDNVPLMDELSWKVIEIWFSHACNLVFIGTSNPLTFEDFNVSSSFREYLFNEGMAVNRFLHIELPPLGQGDIERLIVHNCRDNAKGQGMSSGTVNKDFAREIFMQSGGNPRLAVGMIERFACDVDDSSEESCAEDIKTSETLDSTVSGMAAHVLQKLDSMPAMVRTHLNLAAILGEAFMARDVTKVMEKYRGVKENDRDEHADLVLDSLNEAVFRGILSLDNTSSPSDDTAISTSFKFTHKVWREKILQLTLDSWRHDIQVLIEETRSSN